MFRRQCQSVFFLLALIAIRGSLAKIYPASSLSINSGEGFLFHLVLPPNFDLRECLLIYNATVRITLSSLSSPHETSNSETIEYTNECGARVKNVNAITPGVWRLEAHSKDESVESDSLSVSILTSVADVRIIEEMGISGHFGTIECPGDHNHQRHCEIIDPQNKKIESCEASVKYPPLNSDPKVYQCNVFFWGRIDVVQTEIQVRSVEAPLKIVSKVQDMTSHVVLSCSTANEGLSVCRAESLTTGNQYLIMDGFQSRRYSSWNTQLESGLCQFEIPTPMANNETGVWRIHGKLKRNGMWTGCLFNLNANMTLEYEAFRASLNTIRILETDSEKIDIHCPDSPYPLDYCYLETPTRDVIRPSVSNLELFKNYGRCFFSNVPSATGRYTCGFNSMDHSGDLFQHLDVQFHDRNVLADVQAEIVHIGPSNRFNLMCYALMDHSISSCVFVSPTGELFHLPSSQYSNTRFGYYGRGFVEGECGIEVYHAQPNHEGNWTCSINLVDRFNDINLRIFVRSNGK